MLYPATLNEIPGPLRIVFDLQEIQPIFVQRTAWMQHYVASLTEVMEILPGYIGEAFCAQDGLNAYVERVIEDHTVGNSPGDAQIYAGAVRLVGQYMIDLFIKQGLYRHNGICHYMFEGWLDAQSPVFVKTNFEELYD